ncbi:PVC-type heme-binding CxxCH protein [Catenovulum adriaticum]|uniref:C-type cytochrome n=1 Tax=Catenovulum adriaticum TaxID=2984846 RepID=A0ABY7APN9_9ALTE|nr:PVC-type heme-binding CxxCH protein [Catenovulum sp. TS8]WAJ71280.1 c-type cytochrome [Catenovulum sp. TS8]
MKKRIKLNIPLCAIILSLSGCQSQDQNQSVVTSPTHEHKHEQAQSKPGDRKGHVMDEVVPRDVIPKAPILNLEEALASFEIHPDFELETIAHDPLIFDPLVIQYDAAGRIWALEMTTYMPNTQADGEMKHESQIIVLTDTDKDGKMDDRQVIIGNILLPRALAFIQGGILWADHTKLYFSKVTEQNGKFKLEKTEVVDPTYAKGGNIEHKTNSLLFNLDNWYYNAKSAKRYRPYPLDAELPKDAKEIYRNEHWKMALASTEYRGQWGLTKDDYGRLYFNDNWTPIKTTSFLPNVANRNPKHKFPPEILQQALGTNTIYPIRVTPGINRGYQEGNYREGYKLKYHTAACGPVIYRGNQFPEKYYGIGLVQEPAANLIKATKITEQNGVVSGQDLFNEQEILASTDERFRPVNAYNSPDGTITIVDFYHGILQHRTFLTSYLAEQIKMRDLERSKHIGRLYRLKYKNAPLPKVDYLNDLSATELVPFLTHNNGWHRDMAQQLLVMKQDKSAIAELKKLSLNTTNPLAQIKALWTLEGLGIVDFELIKQVSTSANSKVKRSLYRLVELLPTNGQIKTWVQTQVATVNSETAPILSLAAGTHQVWPALSSLINQFGINDFTFAALASHENDYLQNQAEHISAQAKAKITAVANYVKANDNKLALTTAQRESVNRGKALYNGEAACFGCHGANGEGNTMIPPLNNSEWVVGSEKRLAAILLHGFSGPIEVNGKTFTSPMTMPGLAQNPAMTDEHLADISSYIRHAWDNNAKPVKAKTFKKLRAATQTQSKPYTVETIKNIK